MGQGNRGGSLGRWGKGPLGETAGLRGMGSVRLRREQAVCKSTPGTPAKANWKDSQEETNTAKFKYTNTFAWLTPQGHSVWITISRTFLRLVNLLTPSFVFIHHFLQFFFFKHYHNFLKYLFIYLLAALGLRCCTRAFSSCGERRLFFGAVRELLIVVASLVAEPRL